MTETKYCPRCKQVLPIGEFYVDRKRADGVTGHCRECHNALTRDYDQRRRSELLTSIGGECATCGFDDLRILQIDHVYGGGRQDSQRVTKELIARILANLENYQILCPNHNVIKRIVNEEHVGVRKRKANPPEDDGTLKRCPRCEQDLPRSKWMRNAARHDGLTVYCAECHSVDVIERRRRTRVEIINLLGDKCVDCGYSEDYRALQIDHINGDGHLEEGRSRPTYYKKVLANPDKYALRCANCNRLKQLFNEEFRQRSSYVRQTPDPDRLRGPGRHSPEANARRSEGIQRYWETDDADVDREIRSERMRGFNANLSERERAEIGEKIAASKRGLRKGPDGKMYRPD